MTSVCMATYNGERFIEEQIDSILCQLSPDDELIISDDESTDRTLDIIASYNDKRIKVLHHKKTGSKYYPTLNVSYSTSNFENALKEASGDYIFLSDQDDIWEKNKVKESLRLLQNYDYVIHNFSVIDSDGKLLNPKYYKFPPLKFNSIRDIVHPNFWGCCSCFRKVVLEKVLPFPKKICLHDLWIGLVAERFFKCCWNDSVLIRHRISEINTSSGLRKSENSLALKIRYRVNALRALYKIHEEPSK